MTYRQFPIFAGKLTLLAVFWFSILVCGTGQFEARASEITNNAPLIPGFKSSPVFTVIGFTVEGKWLLPTNVMVSLFTKYAGTNVGLEQITRAASDLELEYMREGYPTMNIIVAPRRITNGIVTLDVFPGAVPQVVVAGNRYLMSSNGVLTPPAIKLEPAPQAALAANTPKPPATATNTNTGPRFTVNQYEINGNTLLSPNSIGAALTNVPGAFGTNVSIDGIRDVVKELDATYRAHGYVTVAVGLPPQRLTNATVKLNVTEGRLTDILVKGNHYYGSNNVMRALPGLYKGMILNGLTFQAEMNRANANQDRQITSLIEPGPDPGTSDLTLQVKDRVPLHAKAELNNQSSPGTPDLRINTSATYNNLWDYEHTVGVQYGFSPFDFKQAAKWHFYDQPLVANYSAFYRMPLGNPEALDDTISANPGTFGYSEASRKFILPPATGQPDLTVFASRSTIDTGLELLSSTLVASLPDKSITWNIMQQDLTINNDIGARLSAPLADSDATRWNLSGGLDFKTYETVSAKTNIYLLDLITYNAQGHPNPPIVSEADSPVPLTDRRIEYLPLSGGINGVWHGSESILTWGLGLSANLWHSGSDSNLRDITGSTKSSGYWVSFLPSFSWQFPIFTNWQTSLRIDGQVTTEPLMSVEQYGIGGINSVRGYHEGEAFGDDGWHVSLEQLTPPHTVGMIAGHIPLVVRGSLYMDYGQVYLLDAPRGAPDSLGLWGTGVGCVASIGSFWETRFLFSIPLLKTADTQTYNPFFNFALTAQF